MSAKKQPVHTVPTKGDKKGWDNVQGGKVIDHSRTKKAAVEKGRKQAQHDQTEHRIHNQDGKIAESNSYGNDPCPPKG